MAKSILMKALWQIPVILLITACFALGFNHLSSDRIPLARQWNGQQATAKSSESSESSGSTSIISIESAALLFNNNKAVFLDARPESLYNEGYIRGALSLPWEDAEEKFIDVTEMIPTGMPIITYCDGVNCDLSDKLASFMHDLGFENVSVLINGWTAWNKHNLPVETGTTP